MFVYRGFMGSLSNIDFKADYKTLLCYIICLAPFDLFFEVTA